MIFLLTWSLIALHISNSDQCTPFGRESLLPSMLGVSQSGSEIGLSRPPLTNNNLFPSSSVRARGENTHTFSIPNGVSNSVPSLQNSFGSKLEKKPSSMNLALGTPSSPPILEANELNCFDFDETCRWRNIDGIFVDELDWYQGSGELDNAKLAVATATNTAPMGSYAIAATDIVQFQTIKAILVSDQIACQVGDGEIRFMYWTSPEVKLKVCVKKMSKVYPDFDFCSSSIDKNDPGPVFINIPDQGPAPFQIYIIADHFTFNSENLKGGFAIIDSIEYYARMCKKEEQRDAFESFEESSESIPLIPLSESHDANHIDSPSHVTVKRSSFVTLAPPPHFQLGVASGSDPSKGIMDFTQAKSMVFKNSMMKLHEPTSENTINSEDENSEVSTVCEAIVCSFNETEHCSNMAQQSDWSTSNGPVGNPLTGIRGDASLLPFNQDGSFAYISGPQVKSRLQTPSFNVDRPVTIVFSYYKADKSSIFQAILKPENSEETVVFDAPKINRSSRRWFRESLSLSAGRYDYIAFEVTNLRPNHYVGIDEMFVVDDRRKSFCLHFN